MRARRASLHPCTQSFVVVIKVIAYSSNVIGETDNSYELFLNELDQVCVIFNRIVICEFEFES